MVVDPKLVAHIAVLANIPITKEEEKKLADGFTTTLAVVDKLSSVDTKNVEPTHQVTGLENIFREDEVDPSRMFSQKDAIRNAKRAYKGFIVVDQIIGE
jgi:aspartyl-tRNA(Asn)/glutamyl-tRNA(Gln) amidotransferase subunit C